MNRATTDARPFERNSQSMPPGVPVPPTERERREDLAHDLAAYPDAVVPCNGCTACCRNEIVVLVAADGDPADWECDEVRDPITGETHHHLKKREDGACVYLGENGCTIHERAPLICRSFDCRIAFLSISGDRAERRRIMHDSKDLVLAAGSARIGTLDAAGREEALRRRGGFMSKLLREEVYK